MNDSKNQINLHYEFPGGTLILSAKSPLGLCRRDSSFKGGKMATKQEHFMHKENKYGIFCITWAAGFLFDDDTPRRYSRSKDMPFRFRLLDGDGVEYFRGYCTDCTSEDAFLPVDEYGVNFGCETIQYYENGKWETL